MTEIPRGPENPLVAEVIQKFPTLRYLRGITQEQEVTDKRDGAIKIQRVLMDGSGMFDIRTPEEAQEWKGIFNHIVGSVRNVQFIAKKIEGATEEQKQKLVALGYSRASIDSLDPQLLTNFMFISHAGRRKADEHAWYGVHETPTQDPQDKNPTAHSYLYTVKLLEESGADSRLVELMRVENHEHEAETMRTGINPNIIDNILTYCDWTYGQAPVPLAERFKGLQESGRQSKEVLDVLETAGTNFENALKAVFGEDIYDQMAAADPFPGERPVREAYAASAGLTLAEVYPDFAAEYAT